MKHTSIKRILATVLSIAVLCFTCTLTASAASSNKIFFGAGIAHEDGADRAWWVNSLSDVEIPKIVNSKGYSGYVKTSYLKADKALDYLKNEAGIFAVHTHGNPTNVYFSDGTSISKSQIDSLPSNTLGNVDLVIYAACKTAEGAGTGSNMVHSTFDKGAKVVIGFQKTIWTNQTNQWLFDFFKSCSNGKLISASIMDGLYWAKFWNGQDAGGTDSIVMLGDIDRSLV